MRSDVALGGERGKWVPKTRVQAIQLAVRGRRTCLSIDPDWSAREKE